ncbi:MAG TPA: peptidoglycan editing factor PgeF [Casimicrobiaceae bacterium]|nr:peptidoglycan editing factor PgeF [Casimicrobiaceae bacterium]
MSVARALAAQSLDALVPQWAAPLNVHAFVSTRNGNAGTSFDLGPAWLDMLAGAPRDAVIANRRLLEAVLPSAPIYLEQTHGTNVARIDRATLAAARESPPRADAAVTSLADVPIAIRVADCLPVLLCDAQGGTVGAAHAGWRGLAAGVLEATIDTMNVEASSLCAWLGPSIGPQAFEVGDDVRDAFCTTDARSADHFVANDRRRWLADLPALARRRLGACGVTRIATVGECTFTRADRYFSWRRDRTSHRFGAFLWRSR